MHRKYTDKIVITLLLFFSAAVFFSLTAFFPARTVIYPDSGYKYMQMRSIIQSGWTTSAVPYNGFSYDPEFRFIVSEHMQRKGDVLQPSYNIFLPFAASMVYPLAGSRAIYLIPLAGFLLSVIFIWKSLLLLVKDRFYLYLLLGMYVFASPVLFFSYIFGEFSLLVMMVSASLYYLVKYLAGTMNRRHMLLSILLIMPLIILRPEALVFLLALGAAGTAAGVLYKRIDIAVYSLGSLMAGTALFIVDNIYSFGSAVSPIVKMKLVSGYTSLEHNALYLMIVCAVTSLALIIMFMNKKAVTDFKRFIPFIAVVFIGYLSNLLWRSSIFGLFTGFPLLLMVLYGVDSDDRFSLDNIPGIFLTILIVLYVIIYSFLSIFVVEFTPRYHLAVIPVVIICLGAVSGGCKSIDRIHLWLVVFLGALSLLNNAEVFKNEIVREKRAVSQMIDAIDNWSSAGDIVIFDNADNLGLAGQLYDQRRYNLINTLKDVKDLTKQIRRKGPAVFLTVIENSNLAAEIVGYTEDADWSVTERNSIVNGLTFLKIRMEAI